MGDIYELQDKQSTIKGMSIASLVLTILCLISLVCFLAAGPAIQSYVEQNKSAIVTSGNFSSSFNTSLSDANISSSLFDVNINGSNIDTKALSDALKKSSNQKVAEFADFLNMATQGDIQGIYDFLTTYDYSQFIDMKETVQNLTDADIQTLVSECGGIVTADQVKALRDTAASVPNEALEFMSKYMGKQGSEQLLSDSMAIIFTFYYTALIIGLIVNLVILVGCILGIVYAKRPKENKVAFVFSIICAVLCLLAIVRMILFIVTAVFLSKARKMSFELEGGTGLGSGNAGGAGGSGAGSAGAGGAAGAQPGSGSPSVFNNVQ